MRNHIDPFLGTLKAEGLQLDVDDAFCRELKRCRHHCDGRRPHIQHRTTTTHDCDHRCVAHVCRGLGATTIRQINIDFAPGEETGWISRAIKAGETGWVEGPTKTISSAGWRSTPKPSSCSPWPRTAAPLVAAMT